MKRIESTGDKLVAEMGFAGDSWRSPVGASEKRTGFGESAEMAKAAKRANAFLLAALGAVGSVDIGAAASGAHELCRVGHCVAKRVFWRQKSKLVGWVEVALSSSPSTERGDDRSFAFACAGGGPTNNMQKSPPGGAGARTFDAAFLEVFSEKRLGNRQGLLRFWNNVPETQKSQKCNTDPSVCSARAWRLTTAGCVQ